jgi:hypothetical protein
MFSSDIAPSRTIFDSSHRSTGLGERPSELRESHDTTRTTSSLHLNQSIRAIALAAALRAEITTLTSIAMKGIASFLCGRLCGRHFSHLFSSRRCRAIHTRDQ